MTHYLIIDEILPDELLETYIYGHCPFCKASYLDRASMHLYAAPPAYGNMLGQKCRLCHSFITFSGTLLFQPRVDRFQKVNKVLFDTFRVKFQFIPLKDKEWALDNDYEIPFSEIAKAHYELEFG